MHIWLATGNVHKKKELDAILRNSIQKNTSEAKITDFELKIPKDAGLDFDPEETGSTFLENALIKAEELYKLLKDGSDYVIAEDSGICVDALNGRPGILSARYGGKSLGAAEKNAMLLEEIGDNPLRSARFVCAMVLYCGPNRFFAVQECLEGELVKNKEAVRGKGGFGYDPVLYISGLGRTVAELTAEEKNSLSHRAKAGRTIGRILCSI